MIRKKLTIIVGNTDIKKREVENYLEDCFLKDLKNINYEYVNIIIERYYYSNGDKLKKDIVRYTFERQYNDIYNIIDFISLINIDIKGYIYPKITFIFVLKEKSK